MGLELAVITEMSHIQDMAEKVLAAGCRTAGLGCLHSDSAQGKTLEKVCHCLRVSARGSFRVGKQVVKEVLQYVPRRWDYRLGTEQVGNHPFRA